MCMRKPSWRKSSSYYPSWKNVHITLTNYTLRETFDIYSLSVVAELSVTQNNTDPVVPLQSTSPPRTAPDMPITLTDHL